VTCDVPHFVEVDLTKTTKHGSDEIYPGPVYLALIGNCYYIGRFYPVWYGLTFDGSFGHRQYDPPGTNISSFKKMWRFDNAEDIIQTHKVVEALLEGTK